MAWSVLRLSLGETKWQGLPNPRRRAVMWKDEPPMTTEPLYEIQRDLPLRQDGVQGWWDAARPGRAGRRMEKLQTTASKRIPPAWSTFHYPRLLQTLFNLALGHFQGSQGGHNCSRQSAPISPAAYPEFCIFTDWLFPQENNLFQAVKNWLMSPALQSMTPWAASGSQSRSEHCQSCILGRYERMKVRRGRRKKACTSSCLLSPCRSIIKKWNEKVFHARACKIKGSSRRGRSSAQMQKV